jgi:lipid-A-disaccharide synthase
LKYYIIAGEASGDLHASNLIRELKALDANADFRCWGGDLMRDQGAEIVRHYRDLAFMGFLEVIANLRTILRNIDFCKKDIIEYKPDAVILVDYPGFNLRIAEFVHQKKIKTIYYISPQVWAWKQSRVKKIRRDVDKMLVILPFEREFYKKFNFSVEFVGHPLLDAVSNRKKTEDNFRSRNNISERKIIALLPGSRKQEIGTMLPLMLKAVEPFRDYEVVIAGAPSITLEFYSDLVGTNKKIVFQSTYELLEHAEAALVTSGTATLETALFDVPQVVCYKGNRISYLIARQLIKINYISLVNLVMDKEVVKELIQDQLTADNIRVELKSILQGEERELMKQNYEDLKTRLGGKGASARAARIVYDEILLGIK